MPAANASCDYENIPLAGTAGPTPLNHENNFVGLTKSANTSKGALSWTEWTEHKKMGTKVDPAFRERMMQREVELKVELQAMIDRLLNEN